MGLVTEVVGTDELMGRVRGLCEMLVANSPNSLRATKDLLRGAERDVAQRGA